MVLRKDKQIYDKIDQKQKAQVNNIRDDNEDITTDTVKIMKIIL